MAEGSFFTNARLVKASANAWNTMSSSAAGRGFQRGAMEALGWNFKERTVNGSKRLINEGFMSLKGRGFSHIPRELSGIYRKKGVLALGGKMLSKFGGAAFLGYSIYEGYQEGGITGAIKGAATNVIFGGALRALEAVAAGPAIIPALMAAGAYGYYQAGEASKQYARGLRNVQMGTPVLDPFGTASTMRQRSLNALQATHINGRNVLGSEAQLLSSLKY